MIPILGDAIRSITDIVAKAVPDADKRMELTLQLQQLADQADVRENQLLLGQIDVDKTEAQSSNLFVAGWRPFIGWTSGSALAYTWILAPIAQYALHLPALPAVPTDQIYPIVMAMLGIAGMRTYEKVQGVAVSTPSNTPTSLTTKIGNWFK